MTIENLLLGTCLIILTPIALLVLTYQMTHRSYSNYDQTH